MKPKRSVSRKQRQQQAEAEGLAEQEKGRIRTAEAARLVEEETQKQKAASEAAAPSEAHGRMFAAITVIVVIASLFVVRFLFNNSATPDQTCYQATDDNIALTACNQAIALDPKDENAYVNRCWTYVRLHNYSAALADCSQAIALNPKDGIAYDNRALNYEKLGENAEAIADNQKALTIDPSDQYAKDALKRLGASPAAPGGR